MQIAFHDSLYHDICDIDYICMINKYHLVNDWMVTGNMQCGEYHRISLNKIFDATSCSNRSRNKRRNLWVGRGVSSWWPWFPSRSSVLIYMYIYIYMYVHSLYEFCYRPYIQWECHSVLAKLHPITLYRGVSGSWAECHFFFFFLVYQLCLALW